MQQVGHYVMLPLNATIVLLIAHYYAIIVPQLCHYVTIWMPLVVTYLPLHGHNICTLL
jgi:hypothetical protein